MENFTKKETIPPKEEKEKNPNTVGELISLGKGLPTFPDKAYRGVNGIAAIEDIDASGIVRNKQSAGLTEKSRWGERVFWSRGAEGKFHPVSQGGYIIEVPLSVVQERQVRKEDVTAIYTKNEEGEIIDILKQKQQEKAEETKNKKTEEEKRINEIRKDLGVDVEQSDKPQF